MATPITDPDNLIDGASIIISTVNKTIRLVTTGLLTTDGVTIKCVYSKLKELWKDNITYIKFEFPMVPITDEQFEMVNGWNWFDDTTRYLLRTGGWAVKNTLGQSSEEWTGIISLGAIASGDQAYLQQYPSGTIVNIQLTGPVNQAVQVYASGSYDYRSQLDLYCREYDKTYAFSDLSSIGVSNVSYQAYRFPLANSTDVKVTHDDATVSGSAPYNGMSIAWFNDAQLRTVGSSGYYFHVIIDGNSGTAEEIYEFVQYKLRQNSDIDASGSIQIGKVTHGLLEFVGDTLYAKVIDAGGIFIDNYLDTDINRLVMIDDNANEVTFPYTASLIVNFGENLTGDVLSKYWIYHTSTPSGSYGTASGILVNDASDLPMSGMVSSLTSITHTFAYDTNTQGGRTPATDAGIIGVAIGTSGAQFVKASGVITRSTGNSISLVSPLERNYQA